MAGFIVGGIVILGVPVAGMFLAFHHPAAAMGSVVAAIVLYVLRKDDIE